MSCVLVFYAFVDKEQVESIIHVSDLQNFTIRIPKLYKIWIKILNIPLNSVGAAPLKNPGILCGDELALR